ncbi:hypothetical protein [Arthrobacter sp. Soil764]|uniref:hypothetical protein n=1 Tax=Arthrobacter sp. Soil764 TaxID=1736403 RepID=UPI0006FFBB7C|nr:hypothetical protein [Arthrobacter sp. Soil764]KRE91831.1 hypothetical protein ASG86_01330 [Arthrobacter sp. Soil764]
MRTAEPLTETEHAHRLSENLMHQLARGREWATPGVQAAVQRAVAGLDTGIETASPRLQVLLRRLADELAGGVETYTPRVQERLRRVGPKAAPAQAPRRAGRMLWWIGALMALAGGAAVWRSMQASKKEPPPSLTSQESSSTDPNVDADLASGRM